VAIRAVCFDLGGVAARISYHWAEMLTRAGYPVPKNICPTDELSAFAEFEPYQAGEIDSAAYLTGLARYIGGLSVEEAKRIHASMLIEPFPGILEIVQTLNRAGIVTGCLSNTNELHWHELSASGRFPAIVAMNVKIASFEIDAAKPNAEAYIAFQKAVARPSGEILLFDDNDPNCRAAQALGWRACHIDPLADPARQVSMELDLVGLGNESASRRIPTT
jgi:FMN phosphatase YigB (HAD superfamily)